MAGMDLPTQEPGEAHRQHPRLGQYYCVTHVTGDVKDLEVKWSKSVSFPYRLQHCGLCPTTAPLFSSAICTEKVGFINYVWWETQADLSLSTSTFID